MVWRAVDPMALCNALLRLSLCVLVAIRMLQAFTLLECDELVDVGKTRLVDNIIGQLPWLSLEIYNKAPSDVCYHTHAPNNLILSRSLSLSNKPILSLPP
jgi:hypothetical protein